MLKLQLRDTSIISSDSCHFPYQSNTLSDLNACHNDSVHLLSHVIIGLKPDFSHVIGLNLVLSDADSLRLSCHFGRQSLVHTLLSDVLSSSRCVLPDSLRNLALSDYLSFHPKIQRYRTLVRKPAVNPDIIGLTLSKSIPISCELRKTTEGVPPHTTTQPQYFYSIIKQKLSKVKFESVITLVFRHTCCCTLNRAILTVACADILIHHRLLNISINTSKTSKQQSFSNHSTLSDSLSKNTQDRVAG